MEYDPLDPDYDRAAQHLLERCLPPWQEELITYISDPIHPRQVLWYFDEAGNTGKSWMASFLPHPRIA
jgi:hypothetical protein